MQAKDPESRRMRRFCSFPSVFSARRRSKATDCEEAESEQFPSIKTKPLVQETSSSVDASVATGICKPQSPSPQEGPSLGIHNPLTFMGIAMPLLAVDQDGRILEWSRELESITCLRRQSLMGSPIESVMDERCYEAWREALREGFFRNCRCDLALKKFSGELACFGAKLYRHSHGENTDASSVLCLLESKPNMFKSHTEQNVADETVRANPESVLQATIDLDNTNNPIFGIDLEGRVTEWNDYMTEITGYDKEDACYCSLVKYFVSNEIQSPAQDVLDNAMDGLGTTNHELQILTKSDETRHLLVNAFTSRDEKNQIVGVVGVAQDVTEAVQRDKAVASMALELRQLIETAASPIFGIDVDGK